MTILRLAAVTAVAVIAVSGLGGCCAEQDRTIGILKIENAELGKKLIEEQKENVRLKERLEGQQSEDSRTQDLITSRDSMIQSLRDQVASLQAALDRREAEYRALVEKMADMGRPAPTSLPGPTMQLLRAMVSTYPGMLEFDEETGRLRFASDLTFELGKADVNPRAAEAVAKLGAILTQQEARGLRVDIVGHTCNTRLVKPETIARFKDNQGLSEARAEAVADILEGAGVTTGRITTRGQGDSQPIAPNDTKQNKARNRRVEVYITNPMAG